MYWFTGLLGILMAIAPWVFGFSDNTSALWTSVALGAVLFLLSAVEAYQKGRVMWEYWTAGLVGLLAIIAPFVLGFSTLTAALWSMIVLGGLALIVSGYEVFAHRQVQ
jgi:hypothetical protein